MWQCGCSLALRRLGRMLKGSCVTGFKLLRTSCSISYASMLILFNIPCALDVAGISLNQCESLLLSASDLTYANTDGCIFLAEDLNETNLSKSNSDNLLPLSSLPSSNPLSSRAPSPNHLLDASSSSGHHRSHHTSFSHSIPRFSLSPSFISAACSSFNSPHKLP